ncbi:transcription factor SPN1, partial [Phenoliferia sp. Uapishka_3]
MSAWDPPPPAWSIPITRLPPEVIDRIFFFLSKPSNPPQIYHTSYISATLGLQSSTYVPAFREGAQRALFSYVTFDTACGKRRLGEWLGLDDEIRWRYSVKGVVVRGMEQLGCLLAGVEEEKETIRTLTVRGGQTMMWDLLTNQKLAGESLSLLGEGRKCTDQMSLAVDATSSPGLQDLSIECLDNPVEVSGTPIEIDPEVTELPFHLTSLTIHTTSNPELPLHLPFFELLLSPTLTSFTISSFPNSAPSTQECIEPIIPLLSSLNYLTSIYFNSVLPPSLAFLPNPHLLTELGMFLDPSLHTTNFRLLRFLNSIPFETIRLLTITIALTGFDAPYATLDCLEVVSEYFGEGNAFSRTKEVVLCYERMETLLLYKGLQKLCEKLIEVGGQVKDKNGNKVVPKYPKPELNFPTRGKSDFDAILAVLDLNLSVAERQEMFLDTVQWYICRFDRTFLGKLYTWAIRGSRVLTPAQQTDNEAGPLPLAIPPSRRQRQRSTSPVVSEHSSNDQSASGSDDDDGDAYQAKKTKEAGKKSSGALDGLTFKKNKKKKARSDGEESGAEGEPRKKKKKTKSSSKRAEMEEEEEEQIDPEVARRRALDARLDAIIKKPKSQGGKRKKRVQGDEDLEAMNDEAIVRLRNDMYTAADADVEENEQGRFAINKLRMLHNVVDMMQKVALAESLIENGILDAVKKWLEPLPDKSLPAINIQRPLFEILRTLSIETSALKSSGIGKVVYFYTKCKRVEPFIQRMANQLVSDWMRPIIRRSKLFTDKDTNVHDSDSEAPHHRRKAPGAGAGATNESIARRHARIPEMLTTAFKNAPSADPRERGAGSGQLQGHSATGVTSKMKTYKKRLVAGQQASRRV